MKVFSFLLACLCTAAAGHASAQTTPKAAPAAASKPAASKAAAAKPGVKPAADAAEDQGKTRALGDVGTPTVSASGKATGPLLTREELRVCLSQEESIRTRMAGLESKRGPLDREKEVLVADKVRVTEDRGEMEGAKQQAEAVNTRTKDYASRVDAWNKLAADVAANGRQGAAGERQRSEVNRKREELERELKDVESERKKVEEGSLAAVNNYNARVAAYQARADDWNKRNAEVNDGARALEEERRKWIAECGDRRYREDDENAIRRGK
jgi:predicted  nucleic acid-binding Zn-ribbon protein